MIYNLPIDKVFYILDIIGIASFAISGFIVGTRKDIDTFGKLLLSFTIALTGGLIRDTITHNNYYAFTLYYPSITVIIVFIILVVVGHYKNLGNIENNFIFILSDAIGLSTFAISGAILALKHSNFNIFGIVFCGMISAVGGGTVRDILLNRTPYIFNSNLYGTIAIINSIIVYILYKYHMLNNSYNILLLTIFGILFRLFAYYKNIKIMI